MVNVAQVEQSLKHILEERVVNALKSGYGTTLVKDELI